MADRFEHAAHFAVATFRNGHAVPAIGALAAAGFDGAELGDAVVKLHAFEQALLFFGIQGAEHAHGVFTLEPETRVHQLVGQLAGAGQQQQAFGVQVEPADRLPLALVELGQTPEHRRAVLRVVVRDDLAGGLVVRDDAGRRRVNTNPDRLAVDLDVVAELDSLTDVRRLGIDRNPTFENQLLHLQARAQAGLRQHLVQFRALRLRRQDTFGQLDGRIGLVSVELAGHHVFELIHRHSGGHRPARRGRCCLGSVCVAVLQLGRDGIRLRCVW